jgi:8-oxo-dGTP diphosphatase
VIRVGIGLIRRGGMYLIRRRPDRPGSPMPGVWEFPGGKSEPGETPAAATRRECREETGLDIVVGPVRRVITHRYAHGLVELHYFDGTTEDPAAEPAPGSGFLWIPARMLPSLRFPEANGPILDELARLAEEPAG